MKDINTRYLQVRGKLEVAKAIPIGQDHRVLVTVTSVEEVDNQDGTYHQVFKAKLFDVLEGEQ